MDSLLVQITVLNRRKWEAGKVPGSRGLVIIALAFQSFVQNLIPGRKMVFPISSSSLSTCARLSVHKSLYTHTS